MSTLAIAVACRTVGVTTLSNMSGTDGRGHRSRRRRQAGWDGWAEALSRVPIVLRISYGKLATVDVDDSNDWNGVGCVL